MSKLGTYLREHHSSIAFWTCASVSIGLMVGSFFCPPMGQIDSSVIMAVGELFAFGALGVIPSAIKEGRSIKVSKGDTSIEVSSSDKED